MWKTLVLSLCVIGVALAEQTPLFLWGANSEAKPSLPTVPQAEFQELLATLLKDHMVVAFEENALTNKDFLCSNEGSATCYAHLQTVSPKTYYNSVENPSEALRAVAAKREHNSVNKDAQLTNPMKCEKGTAVFITFDEVDESRESTLQSHDAAMDTISKQLDCKVAYLYMAAPSTSPPVLRRTRRATKADTNGHFFYSGNTFKIYFTDVKYNSNPLSVVSLELTNTSGTQFNVKLVTSDAAKPITFDIVYTSDGYYNLENVAYNGIKFRSEGVNAPTTFSYFCGDLALGAEGTSSATLTFSSVQFQAPFSANTPDNFVFGDAWHCVGFVTPGILMGLLVVVLLLVIVFVGICWMMDINTMDRFDDPKGKTITINASAE